MPDTLHFSLLGDPQITSNGKPVTGFISTKAKALLCYLAATAQPHSRDHLATLFWGHMSTAAARKNLTKALSNLRKLVGDTLLVEHHSATLTLNQSTIVDLQNFQALLHPERMAGGADAEHRADFPAARVWQADELYRGPFLNNLTITDAPEFELWLETMRVACQQMLIAALESSADQALQAEELDLAHALTARTLHHNPTCEPAHRRLMTLHARRGNIDEALDHYAVCCTTLAQELGVQPDAETTRLYATIRAAHTPPPHNLPTATTRFVGRETELLTLSALLCRADCRLLTITGAGGVGKTRLALQLAEQFLTPTTIDPGCTFPSGIYFLPLTSLDNADTLIARLTERLGFTFYDEGNSKQQLLDALHNKGMLLVLDNVEHLVDSRTPTIHNHGEVPRAQDAATFLALITEILAGSPQIKFVITSRTRLNMQGEHLFSLSGLHYPEQTRLPSDHTAVYSQQAATFADVDTDYSAIHLFIQSARRLQADFVLLDRDRAAVVRICQLVQGMPLGILLAAAWMDIYSPAEIADEISRSLDFLEADLPDLPTRQRSIRAAIDYSWRLLDAQEQALFQRLSIFRGSFSRRAAQQIADASPHLLQSLVKKSLLQPIVQGRFVLHELLRQYAAEKLEQEEAGATTLRNRHSGYFAYVAAEWATALKDERQQQALKAMDADGENLRVAWQWLTATGDVDGQLEMVNGLCQFYLWRGRYQEGMDAVASTLQRLMFVAEENDVETIATLRILLMAWHGLFLRVLGQVDLARQQLEEALAQLQSAPFVGEAPTGEAAFVWLQLGNTSRESDRHYARACYSKSLSAYRAIDDRWGSANTLAALGWLIQHLGAYDQARLIYRESLEIRQTLRDQRGIAGCLHALGGITLYQGNHAEAEQLIRSSIAISSEMNDQVGIAAGLGKLGETLTLLGESEAAIDPLEESIAIYHTLGLQDDEMFTRAVLAHAMLHLGEFDAATHYVQGADTHFRRRKVQRGIAYTMLIQGWIYLAQAAAPAADALLQQSATIYQEIGQLDELGQAQALLGISAYQQGDMAKAQKRYEEAQKTAAELQAFMPQLLAHSLAHLLSYSSTQAPTRLTANANDGAGKFLDHPLLKHSRWFADLLPNTQNGFY